jgi:hypothetical protein
VQTIYKDDDYMNVILEFVDLSEFPIIVRWVNDQDEDFLVQWAGLTYKYPLTVEQMKEHYPENINSIESGVFIYKIILSNEKMNLN